MGRLVGKTSWIIVTGGVLSGLGKGVAAASIGNLLAEKYKVVPIKCDGYLNVDPGTMNPIEHGEVFVLNDGGEVDMDFGHYERFLNVTCKQEWNLTMGKVFEEIRNRERRGDYLGEDVQMIPHVTDFIKEKWHTIAKEEDADVVLLEIGGTIGDIENELYVEAARQLKEDGEQVVYAHLTYVPILANVKEQKSKPTQQSVSLLRARGIQPDILLARCEERIDDKIRSKIALFGGVRKDHVISAIDVANIYDIPLRFHSQGLSEILKKLLGLDAHISSEWHDLVEKKATHEVTIAIAGKYTALEDSYASVIEALKHAGAHNNAHVNIVWLETSEENNLKERMRGVDGVIVPGGFGARGVEGKIAVAKYCRENQVPYLGICYGLQMAVIEHARNVVGLRGANSEEVDKNAKHPVIGILPEQKNITDKGGTMRLGGYPAIIRERTKIYELYGETQVSERHRHRYEVNPEYHGRLERDGLVFSGMSPDGTLVEFLERSDHPYFVATQAHPELQSSPICPAPMFYGLITAARKQLNK